MLVSEGRLFCFSHRFFLRPTTITIRRRGAVRSVFFAVPPPKLNREIENAQMTKPYCNRETVNNYASNSSKSVSRAGESFIFMFCDDACKQNCEKTYANKYSLLCLPALGFLGPNWGSKMTPPRAL